MPNKDSSHHPPASAPIADPFPGVYQLGYVTNDFDLALPCFAQSYGIPRFKEIRPMRYPTREGREAVCNVALAHAGTLQIEVIQPLEGDIQFYRDFLPVSGFTLRVHHVCRLFASIQAIENQIRFYQASGRKLPINAAIPGLARYFYADMRAELGHYFEGVVFEPSAQEWLAEIPKY